MYDPSIHKEHLLAIAQACYDHVDMLWQEDYFELWDKHMVPLYQEVEVGDFSASKANEHYQRMIDLTLQNSDMWFQEDWYDFCETTFDLMLDLANLEGWTDELVRKFPQIYRISQ